MKVEILDHCIRCGICFGLHPSIFAYNEQEDCVEVIAEQFDEEKIAEVKEMAGDCAVAAIKVSE